MAKDEELLKRVEQTLANHMAILSPISTYKNMVSKNNAFKSENFDLSKLEELSGKGSGMALVQFRNGGGKMPTIGGKKQKESLEAQITSFEKRDNELQNDTNYQYLVKEFFPNLIKETMRKWEIEFVAVRERAIEFKNSTEFSKLSPAEQQKINKAIAFSGNTITSRAKYRNMLENSLSKIDAMAQGNLQGINLDEVMNGFYNGYIQVMYDKRQSTDFKNMQDVLEKSEGKTVEPRPEQSGEFDIKRSVELEDDDDIELAPEEVSVKEQVEPRHVIEFEEEQEEVARNMGGGVGFQGNAQNQEEVTPETKKSDEKNQKNAPQAVKSAESNFSSLITGFVGFKGDKNNFYSKESLDKNISECEQFFGVVGDASPASGTFGELFVKYKKENGISLKKPFTKAQRSKFVTEFLDVQQTVFDGVATEIEQRMKQSAEVNAPAPEQNTKEGDLAELDLARFMQERLGTDEFHEYKEEPKEGKGKLTGKERLNQIGNIIGNVVGLDNYKKAKELYDATIDEDGKHHINKDIVKEFSRGALKSGIVLASIASPLAAGSAVAGGIGAAASGLRLAQKGAVLYDTIGGIRDIMKKDATAQDKVKAMLPRLARVGLTVGSLMVSAGITDTDLFQQFKDDAGDLIEKSGVGAYAGTIKTTQVLSLKKQELVQLRLRLLIA
jgi:hypothetical protein